MDYIDYLNNVLVNWTKFCEHHPQFEDAIVKVLLENQRLKAENQKLKERIEKQ